MSFVYRKAGPPYGLENQSSSRWMDPSCEDFKPPVGSLTGRYELLEVLGTGHFSIVYRARDNDGNTVALKLLRGHSGHHPVVFEEEKECLSKAGKAPSTAHVVRLVEGWQDMGLGGCYCLATEPYCSGGSLEAVIANSPVPDLKARLRWGLEVAETLDLLHSTPGVRLYHGDLTPRNVALRAVGRDRYTAYVLDLGVAVHNHPYGMSEALKQYSASVAPEMEQGARTFDQSADVWSWGVLMYALLSWSLARMGGQDERDWLASVPQQPETAWMSELVEPTPGELSEMTTRYWEAVVADAKGPWGAVVALMMDCLRPREERVGMETVVHVMRTLLNMETKRPSPQVCLDEKLRLGRAAGTLCTEDEVQLLLEKARAHKEAQQHVDRRICLERGVRLAEGRRWTVSLLLRCLEQVGTLYCEAGEHDKAISVYERGLYHARMARTFVRANVVKWTLLLAGVSEEVGKLDRAVGLYEAVLGLHQAALPPDRAAIAALLPRLARLHQRRGEGGMARQRFREALKRSKALQHPGVGALRRELALLRPALVLLRGGMEHVCDEASVRPSSLSMMLSVGQAEYTKALARFEEALELSSTSPTPHPDLARMYRAMARLHQAMGHSQQAVPLYEKELALRKEALPPTHPIVLRALVCLARLYKDMGEQEQAVHFYGEALEAHKAAPSHWDPRRLITLRELARVHRDKGEIQRAIRVYEEALGTDKVVLPHEEPELATISCILADLYMGKGEIQPAIELYEEALETYKATFPTNERSIATISCTLAGLYKGRGKRERERAIKLYEGALQKYKTMLPLDGPAVITILGALAGLYHHRGEVQRAIEHYEEALSLHRSVLPTDGRGIATILCKLGGLHQEKGEHTLAMSRYKEALGMYVGVLSHEERVKQLGLCRLAVVCHGATEHARAASLYAEALTTDNQSPPAPEPVLDTIIGKLASWYQRTGQQAQVMSMFCEALAIPEEMLVEEERRAIVILCKLAVVCDGRGEIQRALDLCNAALGIRRGPHQTARVHTCRKPPRLFFFRDPLSYLDWKSIEAQAAVLRHEVPPLAQMLDSLAERCMDMGEHEQAASLYEEVLKIHGVYRRDERTIAFIRCKLAWLRADLSKGGGERERALELYEGALQKYKAVLPLDGPAVISILGALAGLYHHRGEVQRAIEHYEEALEVHNRLQAHEESTIRVILCRLARVHEERGNHERALDLCERAWEMRKGVLPRDDAVWATVMCKLAERYKDKGEHDRAIDVYTEALEIRKAVSPRDVRIITIVCRLAALYRGRGEHERASDFYAEAANRLYGRSSLNLEGLPNKRQRLAAGGYRASG